MSSKCIEEAGPCQFDDSKVNCCSHLCIQWPGQDLGKCDPTPVVTTNGPNTTILPGGENNGNKSINSTGIQLGTGTEAPTTKINPSRCLEDNADCSYNGSMGNCCSTDCYQLEGAPIGYCSPTKVETETGSYSTLIFGICFGLLALGMLVFAFIVWRRMKQNFLTKADIYKFLRGAPDQSSLSLPAHENVDNIPYDSTYEVPKNQFEIAESTLGSGAFGVVKRGSLRSFAVNNYVDVAVKMPQVDIEVKYMKALLSELKLMIYIGTTENVVTLLGAYTAELKKGIVYLFMELCPLGSLEGYLRANKGTFLKEGAKPDQVTYSNVTPNSQEVHIKTSDFFNWSTQIAKALDYLSTKKVVHGDLATRNVLLVSHDHVKITDFGLSRRVYEYTNYVKKNQEPLPWKWMALESLQELSFSTQSDVWAFGVTVWEIFSLGSIPYPGLSWSVDFVQQLQNNLRLPQPTYGTAELYKILMNCWEPKPESRPLPETLVNCLLEMSGSFELKNSNP